MDYDIHESGRCGKFDCWYCYHMRNNDGRATEKGLVLLNLAQKEKLAKRQDLILEKPR